jgi:hypothetical protein
MRPVQLARVQSMHHVQVVKAHTTLPVVARVLPPTSPDEEAQGPPRAMRRPVELREPTPTHDPLVR